MMEPWLRAMRDRLGSAFIVCWVDDPDVDGGLKHIEVRCVLVACTAMDPEFCAEHPTIAADAAAGALCALLREEAGKIGVGGREGYGFGERT